MERKKARKNIDFNLKKYIIRKLIQGSWIIDSVMNV